MQRKTAAQPTQSTSLPSNESEMPSSRPFGNKGVVPNAYLMPPRLSSTSP